MNFWKYLVEVVTKKKKEKNTNLFFPSENRTPIQRFAGVCDDH